SKLSISGVSRKRKLTWGDATLEDEILFFGLEEISESGAAGLGKVSPADVYKMITDMMIDTIQKVGHLPWQKEWNPRQSGGPARNYVTGKPYSGINWLLLNFEQKRTSDGVELVPIKFDQPYYLTMKQIKDQGARLKK